MAVYDGKYVSNKDVRDEGITVAEVSDTAVTTAIKSAELFIERKCSRWFYKKTAYTMLLDGGDHYFPYYGFVETTDLLLIPVPILSLTSVNIYGIDVPVTDFIAFTRIGPPKDDRWNPRIISKNHMWPMEGVQNITLVGDFGFVEDTTGTVPELIKIAARKLAIRFMPIFKMSDPERDADKMSDYISDEVLPGSGYSVTYTKSFDKLLREYSGDSEIDEIIEEYKYKVFSMAV